MAHGSRPEHGGSSVRTQTRQTATTAEPNIRWTIDESIVVA